MVLPLSPLPGWAGIGLVVTCGVVPREVFTVSRNSQVRQQIGRLRDAMQLFQLEWLLETQQEQPNSARLRFLNDAIGTIRDELSELEQL